MNVSETNPNDSNVTNRSPINRSLAVELSVLALIFVVGFASRFLLGDIPNFKPVAALALFGGFYFQRSTLAVVGLVAILMVSDFFLGSYPLPIALSVYFSLGWGCWLGRRIGNARTGANSGFAHRYGRVTGAALVMAGVFFVVTNLAVWVMWYPQTTSGLKACYVSAIPFFKYTLASNLLFSVAVFAVHDIVQVWAKEPASRQVSLSVGNR